MFRFTIRHVLWLTVVVALAMGWWLDRNSLSRECSAWRTVATLLRLDAEAATGKPQQWEVLGKSWPATPNKP